ncbi:MAG: tetratricopeptide repeat protein [Planctomycetota bacterium]
MTHNRTLHKTGSASIALLACIASLSILALGASEVQSLFFKGNELFHQANDLAAKDPDKAKEIYRQAVLRFERIAEEGGVRNGRLYYDIGNIYFRMGDLGRAILNYRRAERYTPNDPNLIQNLRYARSRCADRIEETQEARILKTLLFWHYDFSARARSILFAVCFIAFWVGGGLRILRKGFAPRWVVAAFGILAVVLFASLFVEAWADSRETAGIVLAGETIARKGDSATYEPSFKDPLHAGAEFQVVEDRGEWINVRLVDGRSCWLPKKDIGLVK